MLLAKSCHDMDILAWLIGKPCTKVHSFGSLMYFKPENAPADAPEYCIDGCPHKDTCYYHAPRLYIETFNKRGFACNMTHMNEPTDEAIDKALRETEYGKCVFKCSNNVVDHQTVNLEFEGGVTVGFTMSAFNKGGRSIRIMGTDGELSGNMGDDFLTLFSFATRKTTQINISDAITYEDQHSGGHGGGDEGIVRALNARLNGRLDNPSICEPDETYRNHLIAFAADQSRLCGTVVDMKEYEAMIDASLKEKGI